MWAIVKEGRKRGYSTGNIEFLLKQAKCEAGPSFESRAVREDNNVFGMGRVYKRPTTQINYRAAMDGSGQNTIGKYSNVYDSVIDRFMWDEFYKLDVTAASYPAAVVGKNYNSKDNYLNSVMNNYGVDGIEEMVSGHLKKMLIVGAIITTAIIHLPKLFKNARRK